MQIAKKDVALIIVAFCIGFIGMNAYMGTLPQITQLTTTKLAPLTDLFKPAITRIQTAWTSLPSPMQGIILAGIPTLFAVFFAWTKSRAMQKLQQTQAQSNVQYSQLTGQISEAQQQVNALEQQKTQLEQQVKGLSSQGEATRTLSESLQEAQNLVVMKQQELDSVKGQVLVLQDLIAKMKLEERIVVK